jgi:hypothetical protein
MRYCPHCSRFNPGRPPICHFCGCTWYVRLCPRGHENPFNAQYCGTCGSADLSETAGRRPWFLVVLKGFLWLLACLLVYSVATGFWSFLKGPQITHLISFLVVLCLLVCGFWFALSLLPGPLNRLGQRIGRCAWRLCVLMMWGLLKLVWRILR